MILDRIFLSLGKVFGIFLKYPATYSSSLFLSLYQIGMENNSLLSFFQYMNCVPQCMKNYLTEDFGGHLLLSLQFLLENM